MRTHVAGAVGLLWVVAVLWGSGQRAWAEEDLRVQVDELRKKLAGYDDLKKEIEGLRKDKLAAKPIDGKAIAITDQKYGPDAPVKTKAGKLTLSGLVQVWYYGIQNDKLGVFGDLNRAGNGHRGGDTNEGKDNDSFRIRRAELRFTMDINENIQAVVMFDPAREATNFPNLPAAPRITAPTLGLNGTPNPLDTANPTRFFSGGNFQDISGGTGTTDRILQDAYVLYHDFVPHHEFQIGQFKPQFGEEGIRSSGQLDFAERSIVGQYGENRDLGASVRGYWWDTDRFQYWFGAFDNAGNFLGTDGQLQNRSDTNDQKDLLYRLLVRPLWKNETWGSLELGGGSEFGFHGESGSYRNVTTSGGGAASVTNVDGLQRSYTGAAVRHGAWAYYAPGSYLKGLWLRGEGAWIRDTNPPNTVNTNTFTATGVRENFGQQQPGPTHVWGITGSFGYKLGDSIWKERVPGWFKPFEFVARYEQFQNIWYIDPAALVSNEFRRHTNVVNTKIVTAGFNYYIKGHNAKIQFNYNWVNEAGDGSRFLIPKAEIGGATQPTTANTRFGSLREVRNDNFILNFQVAW